MFEQKSLVDHPHPIDFLHPKMSVGKRKISGEITNPVITPLVGVAQAARTVASGDASAVRRLLAGGGVKAT